MKTIASWIESSPDRCGGDACIRATRIPVWVLVNERRHGWSDEQMLAAYPTLAPTDLEAAWEYAQSHSDEIEQAIRENEAGDEGFVE